MDFFNALQDYFSTLSQREMLFFWLVAGLLFVIGLMIGLLVQRSRLKRYRAQYLITDKERADFEARAMSAEGKLNALEKEVATLSREKVAVIQELEDLKKRPAVNGGDPVELEQLREEIQLLKSENERLSAALGDYRSSKGDMDDPTIEPGTAPADVQDYLQAAEARFEAFEQRLQELTAENDRLNTEVSQLKVSSSGQDRGGLGAPYGKPHQPIIGTAAVEEIDDEPLVIRADVTDPGARTDNDGGMEVIVDTKPSLVVPVLPPESVIPDDLKLINNIGPFLEKKLNEQGVYTYDQIASWSDADIDKMTDAIAYIPGIISKEDWVGQAASLRDSRPDDLAVAADERSLEVASVTAVAKPKKQNLIKPDNLQVIEGIGPKIESILKDAGIENLSELSTKNPDELREMLAAAGSRFKSHNPDSWPEQARLAAAGELEALKVLQDSM